MPNAPQAVSRVVLTGFMGSGKTTAGRILAERLGWTFLDLDHEIEAREKRTVPQIFAQSGEAAFRRIESATLADVIERNDVVLALGGGALEERQNRELLQHSPTTLIVLLSAPFATLFDRCVLQSQMPGQTARPLLLERDATRQRFERRLTRYEEVAHVTVDTSELAPDEVASAVEQSARLLMQKRNP